MSNPNFLTANTSGIELMPGVNDNAVGYDVNRVIQALNGINLIPITTGNLTVSGTLNVSGLATLSGGISMANQTIVGPITINPGPLTVNGDIIIDAPGKLALGAGLSESFLGSDVVAGNNFERYFLSYGVFWDGTQWVVTDTVNNQSSFSDENGIWTWTGHDGALTSPQTNASWHTHDVLTLNHAGQMVFKATGSQIIAQAASSADFIDLSNITSQAPYIRGSTSGFGVVNSANSRYNLTIADNGSTTITNYLNIPPSAQGTPAPTSYGTVPIKITETVLGASASSVTFSSIPSGFRSLIYNSWLRSDVASANINQNMRINGDSGANYDQVTAYTNSTGWTTGNTNGGTFIFGGWAQGTTGPANAFAYTEMNILRYDDASHDKVIRIFASVANAYSSTNIYSGIWTAWWHPASPAAITSLASITSSGNYVSGSTFILQGEP